MKGIRQHDIKDCGAACLATILRYYKSYIPMVKIREKMCVDKNGASMFSLCKTANHFGLIADGYQADLSEVVNECAQHNISLPIILHIVNEEDMFHYVVLNRVTDKHVYVFDPAKGNRKISINDFETLFTGFFIKIKPGENFQINKRTLSEYKKFINIISKQKSLFFSSIFISIILAIFSILSSFAYQTIVDKYILGNEQSIYLNNMPIFTQLYLYMEKLCHSLPQLFLAILTIYILQNIITFLRGIIITYIYKNSSNMLVLDYCNKLTKLPLPFFHNRETGEILSRYNDIEDLQNIISGIGLTAILDIVMAIAGAMVLFTISPKLFAIVIIMTITYSVIAICYRRPIKNVSRSIMEADSSLISKMKETVDGIESIKSSCAEKYINNTMQDKINKYIKLTQKGALISVSQFMFIGLSQSIGSVAILYFGCQFMIEGSISLGTFISFETLIYFFISPVQNLLSMQITLQQAFVAADRLNDVMENNNEDMYFNGEKEFNLVGKTNIIIDSISFAYGYNDPILKNITLSAHAGEKIALVGESGCGKTTFLHILGMLKDGYRGKIFINGENIRELNKMMYREKVIYVPQDSAIFADSIKNNILMGYSTEIEDLKKVIQGCQLVDLIESQMYGIETMIEENGKNLSGGQKQRIAIARALVRKPEIILLDESTSHLDKKTEEKIFNFISYEYPTTICLFSTHRQSLIELCDRKIEISRGIINE